MSQLPADSRRMVQALLSIRPEDVENAPDPDAEELNRPIVVRPEQDVPERSDQ